MGGSGFLVEIPHPGSWRLVNQLDVVYEKGGKGTYDPVEGLSAAWLAAQVQNGPPLLWSWRGVEARRRHWIIILFLVCCGEVVACSHLHCVKHDLENHVDFYDFDLCGR